MHNLERVNLSIATAIGGMHPDSNAVIRSMLNREIQSVIGYRSSIQVECNNGVVTLTGYFANKNDQNRALRKAISNPCVSRVVNNAN